MKHSERKPKREDASPNEDCISIRYATNDDEGTLVALAKAENMGELHGFDDTLIAQVDSSVAGFCRIRIIDGIACVNPIVVAPLFRKRGIGKLLMNRAFSRFGPLTFVARGSSVGFYTSIGCVRSSWSEAPEELVRDCISCSERAACNPVPMIMSR